MFFSYWSPPPPGEGTPRGHFTPPTTTTGLFDPHNSGAGAGAGAGAGERGGTTGAVIACF